MSEKERKAAKLKAMQAKLAAAGVATAEVPERKAAKLKAMREKLAAAGFAEADDLPDAEAARRPRNCRLCGNQLAAAELPTPDKQLIVFDALATAERPKTGPRRASPQRTGQVT